MEGNMVDGRRYVDRREGTKIGRREGVRLVEGKVIGARLIRGRVLD